MQTFSSRDFQRAPGVIKRAAVDGAVIITERGRPIIAVMPFAEYERLKAPPGNILDALDMDEVGNIDVDFSRRLSVQVHSHLVAIADEDNVIPCPSRNLGFSS